LPPRRDSASKRAGWIPCKTRTRAPTAQRSIRPQDTRRPTRQSLHSSLSFQILRVCVCVCDCVCDCVWERGKRDTDDGVCVLLLVKELEAEVSLQRGLCGGVHHLVLDLCGLGNKRDDAPFLVAPGAHDDVARAALPLGDAWDLCPMCGASQGRSGRSNSNRRGRRGRRREREKKRISFERDAVLAPTALSTRTSAGRTGQQRGREQRERGRARDGPFSILTIMKRWALLPLANVRTNSSEAAGWQGVSVWDAGSAEGGRLTWDRGGARHGGEGER